MVSQRMHNTKISCEGRRRGARTSSAASCCWAARSRMQDNFSLAHRRVVVERKAMTSCFFDCTLSVIRPLTERRDDDSVGG